MKVFLKLSFMWIGFLIFIKKIIKIMFFKKKKLFFLFLFLLFPQSVTLLESFDEKNYDFFEIIFDDDTPFYSKESLSYHHTYFITILSSLTCLSSIFLLYLYNPHNMFSFNFRDNMIINCHNIDQLFFLLESELPELDYLELWVVLYELDVVVDYKPFAINFLKNMILNIYSNNAIEDPNYVRKLLVALISEIEAQYY